MKEGLEEARQRARERRQRGLRLGREMAEFASGAGGIDALGQFVKNEKIVLSNRLEAVEVAIQRGIVSLDEIQKLGFEPMPSDFGLPSSEKPRRIPKSTEKFCKNYDEKIILSIIATSIISLSYWIYIRSDQIFLAMIGGLFGGVFIAMPVMGVGAGLVAVVNGTAPGSREWRRFDKAKTRYEILVATKRVLDMSRDVRAFQRANGPEFERLTARAFRRCGYRVNEMGGANDGGVDLIVQKGAVRAIVQCKAHGKQVGPAVVRELAGALGHCQASLAYLATTNGVSERAREWAEGKAIIFLQPDDLIQGRL